MDNTYLKLLNLEPKSMQSYFGVTWHKAKNEWVWVRDNYTTKKMLDFSCGIFVQNFGHSNSYVKKELKKQLNKNLWHTYLNASDIRKQYLSKLLEYDYNKKALLLSSGTEATEACIKLMNLWGKQQDPKKKYIISFSGSMHGRTMGASLLKNEDVWQEKHPQIISLDYDKTFYHSQSCAHLYSALKDRNIDLKEVAGIIIEAYRGYDLMTFKKEHIGEIIRSAKVNNFLLAFDCIQSGFFRTGTKKGYEYLHDDLNPDLLCYGKAIGGGLPLSCVIGNKEIMDIPDCGNMSSTHSANPLCCAAGLGILKQIDNLNYDLLQKNLNEWKKFQQIVQANYWKDIKINRINTIAALIFKSAEVADQFVTDCFKNGLIVVRTGRESVKIAPPITIKTKNLLNGFNIILRILDEYNNEAFGNICK